MKPVEDPNDPRLAPPLSNAQIQALRALFQPTLDAMRKQAESELATASEVAKYLSTNTATLAQWRYLGKGPKFIKAGGLVRYRWVDVADWVDRNERQQNDRRFP